MYLIWSKELFDLAYCIIICQTFTEVNTKFDKFKITNGIDDPKCLMTEFNDLEADIISFSRIGAESNFYFSKLDDITTKKIIYILEYSESSKDQSHHEQTYISWNYNLNDIIKNAVDFFESVSVNIDKKTIDKFISNLKKKGYHHIENSVTYYCGFKLYKLTV